jgi:peptidyl-prolyl cis-trans isomerase C
MHWVLVACLVIGCQKNTGTTTNFERRRPEGVAGGKPVAQFAGDTLTDAEITRRLMEMSPYARARYQTAEQRREYVDGLVRFELLAQEAVRRGLHNDPEVVETAKRVMVQRLLTKELDEGAPPSDAEVGEYYNAHRGDYIKPAMTRLAHIAFKKSNREQAERILKETLALPPLDYASFSALAKKHSEDPRTQPLEGDMRFLADDEITSQFGAELLTTAATLQKVGEVAPTLVASGEWLHVLKLQGRQQAMNLTLEQAKPSIGTIITNDVKQRRLKVLLDGLVKKAAYTVDAPALGALTVDAKAPAVETKQPQPGFIPAPVESPIR